MKLLPIIILLAVLASCGAQTPETDVAQEPMDEITIPTDDELLDDMSSDLNEMETGETESDMTSFENEVLEFDAAYRNPAGPVDMIVAMQVQDGVIQSISASATSYDVSWFSDKLQTLVGSTVAEAESFYAAGSSLASEAFNNAVKAL